MDSQIRQNYHRDCEAAVNRAANAGLRAAYAYLAMAFYFERDDVALPRLGGFFRGRWREERERAQGLLRYQARRGGRALLQDVQKPERDAWGSALEGAGAALRLQKSLNRALLELRRLAAERGDPHLCDFLDTHHLPQQVAAIKRGGDAVTNLRRLAGGAGGAEGPGGAPPQSDFAPPSGFGEYLFDRLSLEERS